MVLQALFPEVRSKQFRTLSIRKALSNDLPTIHDWATHEDWNPGQQDLMVYQQQQGLYVAEIGEKLVGCISALRYTQDFGFIGCYLVDMPHRGHGYGHHLWRHALNSLAGATIGLEGATALQNIYCQNGFVRTYHHIRYEVHRDSLSNLKINEADLNCLQPIRDLDFSRVNAYDKLHFASDRSAFLQSWLDCNTVNGVAYIQEGQIRGYGCIRPAVTGHRIGPLFADNAKIAKVILKHLGETLRLAKHHSGCTSFFLDIPQINPDAIALMQQIQARKCFSNCRMYLGTIPLSPTHQIYGNTTLEAG